MLYNWQISLVAFCCMSCCIKISLSISADQNFLSAQKLSACTRLFSGEQSVVSDILTDGFWKAAAPVMLRYVGPEQYKQIVVRTSPEHLLSVNDYMKNAWRKISPNTLYNGSYTDGNMYATQMINTNAVRIFGFLGIIAAVMSATGLYALVSLNIIKKMKEIGVRKVLGASAGNIVRVINTEFIIILLVASLFGSTLGYFMTDKMMDAIWEYYLPVNAITLGICVVLLFCGSRLQLQNRRYSLGESCKYITRTVSGLLYLSPMGKTFWKLARVTVN